MMLTTPLLLLPGLMNDERVWAHQLPVLSRNGRTVVVCRTDGHDRIDAIARAAIDSMPPGPFAVAGFSLGGYAALEIFRQVGDRVSGIALLDTGAREDSEATRQTRQRMIAGVDGGAATFSSIATAFLPRVVHPSRVDDAALSELLISMATAVGSAGFVRQQQAALSRPDSRELLDAIACPALIVCGRQDAIAPVESSEEMAAHLVDVELVLIDHCGHMAPLEQPDAVDAALVTWLAKVDAFAALRN